MYYHYASDEMGSITTCGNEAGGRTCMHVAADGHEDYFYDFNLHT